jgi:hypothetical protein
MLSLAGNVFGGQDEIVALSQLIHEQLSHFLQELWLVQAHVVDVWEWFDGIHAIVHDLRCRGTRSSQVIVVVLLCESSTVFVQSTLDGSGGRLGRSDVQNEIWSTLLCVTGILEKFVVKLQLFYFSLQHVLAQLWLRLDVPRIFWWL